jgi:hypothetical protein
VTRLWVASLAPAGPGPDQLPEHPDDGWQVVGPFVHGRPSPIVELHGDPLPGWWEGPYRQDVPK